VSCGGFGGSHAIKFVLVQINTMEIQLYFRLNRQRLKIIHLNYTVAENKLITGHSWLIHLVLYIRIMVNSFLIMTNIFGLNFLLPINLKHAHATHHVLNFPSHSFRTLRQATRLIQVHPGLKRCSAPVTVASWQAT
jgi:hypothetical protein